MRSRLAGHSGAQPGMSCSALPCSAAQHSRSPGSGGAIMANHLPCRCSIKPEVLADEAAGHADRASIDPEKTCRNLIGSCASLPLFPSLTGLRTEYRHPQPVHKAISSYAERPPVARGTLVAPDMRPDPACTPRRREPTKAGSQMRKGRHNKRPRTMASHGLLKMQSGVHLLWAYRFPVSSRTTPPRTRHRHRDEKGLP
jgi:hypothetical protein